ncbi:MAG: ABC transporter ATP-binding protein [Candidatus Thorarchaeota archaeon]
MTLRVNDLDRENSVLYRIINLKRYYQMKTEIIKAVDGINLEVKIGEFLAILGPSGSGKTTFLNLLTGLDKPTGGRVIFNGGDLNAYNDSELCDMRRYDIGIIFQFYNLHPSYTAVENIEYAMMIANVPQKKCEERARELLDQVKLEEKRDNYPIELSGGEKQLIGIARALANDPKVIIADEPTGDLDSENADMVIKFLRAITQQGKTTIIVTHDESLLSPEMKIMQMVDGQLYPKN